jgi:hypothetical protein
MTGVAGNATDWALAVLCVGAVSFLLWVLVALVKEHRNTSVRSVEFYWARVHPPRQQAELGVVTPEVYQRSTPPGADERVAS